MNALCPQSEKSPPKWPQMGVEGWEKGVGGVGGSGGVGEESSLATQWQGDVPGATLLCPAEFIAAVKNCGEVACGRWSESADWSRPGTALLRCRALWESVSLTEGNPGTCGHHTFISLLIFHFCHFFQYSTSHHRFRHSMTSRFQGDEGEMQGCKGFLSLSLSFRIENF